MSLYPNEPSNLEPEQPPEESSNRTFLIAAGVLGGIVLLSLACLAGVYFFSVLPSKNATNAAAAQQATLNAQAKPLLTASAQAAFLASLATQTPAPTDTPVLAEATFTPIPAGTDTPGAVTATVGAALTQAAIAQLTVVPTSTALPKTGIGDQLGYPGLVIAAMVLIAVIFLARRLRATPMK
jgi:hypothetical protein